MKIIKKINNNYALAVDDNGKEIIVGGKGIGFKQMPYMIDNHDTFVRTYYGIHPAYIPLLSEIPEEIMTIAEKVVDYAKNIIETPMNPNMLFTLADHIDFCIKRLKNGIKVDFSKTLDFRFMYRNEIKVGDYAIKLIRQELNIELPNEEKYGFAINIINSEVGKKANTNDDSETVINHCIEMIETELEFKVSRNTVNYERFIFHMEYLIQRLATNKEEPIDFKNPQILKQVREQYPEYYNCVKAIDVYLRKEKGWSLNDDELLYLIMHINRLYSHETLA